MTTCSDRELIVRYVRRQDHEAFAELVRRYIALVHSAALRQTREPALADDVTQAVMIVLARGAREIAADVVLASWLFTVTHHVAQNALKSRARRIVHEQIAAEQRTIHYSPDPAQADLRDVLDAAIAKLPDIERGGVVLHYFSNCTHEEIAGALGMSSEAVRKRVTRAIAKLRDFVAGRGFDLSTPALSAALQTEGTSSPHMHQATTNSIVSVALLATTSGAAPTSASAILAQGVLCSAKTALKWKIAATIAIASAGLAGIAAIPLTPPIVQAISATAPPTTAPTARSGFAAQVTPKIRVEALASAPHPAEPTQWFSIDGKPIDMPHEALVDNQVDTDSQPDRQIVFKVDLPAGNEYTIFIPNSRTWSTTGAPLQGDTSLYRCRFAFNDPPPETLTVLFNIATNDWQTIASIDELREETEVDAGAFGSLTFSPPADSQRWGPHVNVRHPGLEVIPRMFAIDKDGTEHVQKSINNDRAGPGEAQAMFIFDIPAKDIRGVRLQIREFDKQVEFTNIALQPDQHTEPKVVVKDLKAKK